MVLVQARTNSKRFPGKVLADLNGKPVINHVFERVSKVTNQFMVVIPEGDTELIKWAKQYHTPYFEGSAEDVLDRYWKCAVTYKLQWVVRITADCPLINPTYINQVIQVGQNKHFASNCILPCPDGWEVEYLSAECLKWAKSAANGEDKEHVTTFIKKNLDSFKAKNWAYASIDCETRDWVPKLSIDTKEDLERIKEIMNGK